MSLASVRNPSTRPGSARAELVAALDSIDGITASPVAPDQATAGAAFPKWIQSTYDGHLCTLADDTYDVIVTLPADHAGTTVDEGDALRDVVALALARVCSSITYAEPVQITFQDRQTMPGLRFRVVTH
jgi:hypothetical protein